MTIKHQLFISNIRIIIISFATVALISRLASYLLLRTGRPSPEAIKIFMESYKHDMGMIWILGLAIFIILISVINNLITHRMTKRIIKPLTPLNNGVRQIHDNNFSYRIDYKEDDEFRPVCEAFNEMAEKLEISAVQHKKDEANRRELIAGISHDLRTPLTSIKGCIEGIETGVASTPEMREKYLAIIKNKTASLEHIIEQLFLFSKLDMDDFSLNMRRTDISLAVSEMIEDALSEYSSRGLNIELAEMQKNIYVLADVFMLQNVIVNILENSVKYKTKDHGQMGINTSILNDFILLRLTDDGPGVQADMLPKLFDVFYRTDPSRSKRGYEAGSSGMGLAISEKIITLMGGNIYAELPDAGGLSIVIKLPILKGENNNA